ncbi:MAG: DUF3579 domain-containing protein [Pseudomonadota bacterium]
MAEQEEHVVIESVRSGGERFRPSDWIERISASLATFGKDHRLHYSDDVYPCVIEGQRCLLVRKGLAEDNPSAFDYIMHFAQENELRIQEDRRHKPRPGSPLGKR